MKSIGNTFFAGALMWMGVAATAYAGTAPTVTPTIFAPGIISGPAHDEGPTFSLDGKTVYFFRSNGEDYDIMVSHLKGAHWSQPGIASFSGRWRDLEPSVAPGGSYLIFASSRPVDGSKKPLDGHWHDKLHPRRGGNLWRVNRKGDHWSKPVRLPDTVNRFDSTFSPAIAADGSVYFMAATGPGGHFQLYCAHFKDGHYQPAKVLSLNTGQYGGVDPAVAPDQSFIVFASNRPPAPPHHNSLFIAFRAHGHWGKPIAMGPGIGKFSPVELGLGPDGRTLYFSSGYVVPPNYPKTIQSSKAGLRRMQVWNDGNGNIWTIDLTPWLKAHRKQND